MSLSYYRWKRLLLFCLGLGIASSICMKWMETDFWVNGERFTIMGLELFYSKERLLAVLSGLDEHVKAMLGYHLRFDFIFMAGVYPAITALCMMARGKIDNAVLRKFLFILAALQLLAWAADIRENLYLLEWMKHPVNGIDANLYHFIVAVKWVIALVGFIFPVPVLLINRKNKMDKTHFLI